MRARVVFLLVAGLLCLSALPASSRGADARKGEPGMTGARAGVTEVEGPSWAPLAAPTRPRLVSGQALLAFGAACLTLGWVRYRRRRMGGFALLLLAPTVLLVGGYLTSGATLARARQAAPLPTPAIGGLGGVTVPTGSIAAFSTRDQFLYSLNGRIWALSPSGGAPSNLTPDLAIGAYATSPALSPDGTTLAFVQSTLPQQGQAAPSTTGLVTELYLMDVSGADRRRILASPRPEATLADPVWAEGGRALIFTLSLPTYGPDGRIVGATTAVERLEVASGQHATLVANGAEPGVSPAGANDLYAYAATDREGTSPRLLIASVDGRIRQQLIGSDAGFQAFHRPRFSRDGQFIIFAAVGGPQGLPGREPAAGARSVPRRFVDFLAPRSASAHGQPQDLWIVRTDGTGLRRLTRLNADEPSPAWSPDSRQIAFLASDGLYLMDRAGQGLVKIATTGGYSALIWTSR